MPTVNAMKAFLETKLPFEPYPHQRRVADLLLAGENVILQAPTGAGKTRAALLPFLEALHPNSNARGKLPSKCIYAVPMRVLARQFTVEYEKSLREFGLSIAHPLAVKQQTGDQSDDPYLEGDLIFATIDQVLSSFLMNPYSLSQRRGNLNAGAILSSYLVFDEFHLFDPVSTLPTTLHMLKMLKGITPFLLMTATFGETMVEQLAQTLDAKVVGLSAEEHSEFARLESQQKTRCYHTVDGRMTAERILAAHQQRTLVICNTVDRARHIYRALRDSNTEARVLLLHSRFLPADRQATEMLIRTQFAQGQHEGNYIVVSTQAIEVGLDITSTVLHTELAPANAIVQRAGRCARYEGDAGDVFIYKMALDKEGEPFDLSENTTPYDQQEAVIAETWAQFVQRDGSVLAYEDELHVINAAHRSQDEKIIAELNERQQRHRQDMYAVMRGDDGTDARTLIREVLSQPITIHDDPHQVAKDPFAYPSFSLHPGSVQGLLKAWVDRRAHEWQVCAIRPTDRDDDKDQANHAERYAAVPLNDKSQGYMARLIVVHSDLATYSHEEGFISNEGGNWNAERPETSAQAQKRNYGGYKLETYERHIELVYREFEKFWPEALWAARRLEQANGWAEGSVTRAAQLAVLLHDVGKLSVGWQSWAHAYQQALFEAGLIKQEPQAEVAYAHTHTNPNPPDERKDDPYWKIERSIHPGRPWHAVEGALAVVAVVLAALNNNQLLTRAVFSAMARHHAPHSDSYRTFRLWQASGKHIAATLPEGMALDLSKLDGVGNEKREGHSTGKVMAEPSETAIYFAYMLFARALRRADASGTKLGR